MALLNNILITIALAFIPPLLWLWFWLKEDNNPEPGRELFAAFLAGMGGVIIAVLLENSFSSANIYFQKIFIYGGSAMQLANLIGFAFIEEIVKTGAAFIVVLRSRFFDEPVDAMIYLITAALGFAALENVLFISDTLKTGIARSVIVSAFRFFNAVLLHVSSMAIIGAGFSFSFFHKERRVKELALAIFLATVLHSLYNFLIIKSADNDINYQIWATLLVILGAAAALVLFEKAKRVNI